MGVSFSPEDRTIGLSKVTLVVTNAGTQALAGISLKRRAILLCGRPVQKEGAEVG